MTARLNPFSRRFLLPAIVLGGLFAAVAGCQPFDHRHDPLAQPIPSPMEPAREKTKVSLPAYRIEPPDQ